VVVIKEAVVSSDAIVVASDLVAVSRDV